MNCPALSFAFWPSGSLLLQTPRGSGIRPQETGRQGQTVQVRNVGPSISPVLQPQHCRAGSRWIQGDPGGSRQIQVDPGGSGGIQVDLGRSRAGKDLRASPKPHTGPVTAQGPQRPAGHTFQETISLFINHSQQYLLIKINTGICEGECKF